MPVQRLLAAAVAGVVLVVIVYFSTTCTFCRAETRSLVDHRALHDTARVLMASSECPTSLRTFVREYGLDTTDVQVVHDAGGAFADSLGISTVPNTFVYGADRRLIKHFRGESSASLIYEALVNKASRPAPDRSRTFSGDCAISPQPATVSNADCPNTK